MTRSASVPPHSQRWLDMRSLVERLGHGLPAGQSLPDALFASRHRAMVRLLWAHAVALPVVALFYGASAWHALVEGAIIGAFGAAAWLARGSGRRFQAAAGALGLLTCSAVLVHITGGLIEAHFHFFVIVTALTLYEDWIVFATAIGYVVLHHGLGPTIAGDVFSHPGDPWKWAVVHGLFIAGLCVANVAVWRAAEESRRELAAAKAAADEHAAELERSNSELEQFAYVASHDLSEPLRMIASYLNVLDRRYGDQMGPDGRQLLDYSVGGAARMRALIDDLLAYSRVGRGMAVHSPVDVRETVDETLRALATAVEEADAAIEVGDLPVVEGNPTELSRLFQNLIANAIKFRNSAPPHVAVAAEREDGEWVFTVRDNGIGIPDEQRDHVFEMFGRLHTRDAYEGNGIGLATCRKIVEGHGGRIWVEPAPAGGSAFRFTIPAR